MNLAEVENMAEPTKGPMRVAIVGTGRMGSERARAAKQWGAEVIALYDPDSESARALAEECGGARVLSGVGELPWEELSAIFVCTPPSARGEVEREAIRRGVSFFVEKPVGLDSAAAESTLRALLARPVINAVGYMNRYRPSVLRARELIRARPLLGLSAHWVGKPYRKSWWFDPAGSGGAVNEQATHLIDLARFLGGELEWVSGMASDDGLEASCALQFETGPLFSILYSARARVKTISVSAFAEDRTVSLDGWELGLRDDPERAQTPGPDPDKGTAFRREVEAFLSAVRRGDGAGIWSPFPDAFETQRVVDALRRAFESGRRERVR